MVRMNMSTITADPTARRASAAIIATPRDRAAGVMTVGCIVISCLPLT